MRRKILFLAAGGGFLFAFADAVTLAVQDHDFGMVSEAVEQGGDAGGVGEDLVPFFEGSIGGNGDSLIFVALIDHRVEQVRGVAVVGKVAHFVNAQERRTGVPGQLAAIMTRASALYGLAPGDDPSAKKQGSKLSKRRRFSEVPSNRAKEVQCEAQPFSLPRVSRQDGGEMIMPRQFQQPRMRNAPRPRRSSTAVRRLS